MGKHAPQNRANGIHLAHQSGILGAIVIVLLAMSGCTSEGAKITPIDLDSAATGTATALTAMAPNPTPIQSEVEGAILNSVPTLTPTPGPTVTPTSYRLIPHPGGRTLRDVEFVSANDGWVVGDGGIVLHFINGRWVPFPIPGASADTTFHSVEMLNHADGWIAGGIDGRGMLYRYQNGVWLPYDVPPNVGPLTVVRFGPDGIGWAGGQTHLISYRDGRWEMVAEATIGDIDFTDGGVGWAVGEHGIVGRYQDGIWVDAPRPGDVPLTATDFVAPDEGWAVAANENGSIYHYQYGMWEEQTHPAPGPLYDVLMLDGENGWAAGCTSDGRGFVLKYRDGIWAVLLLAAYPTELPCPMALEMVAPGRLWAVGAGIGTEAVLIFDG